jgi:transcriptional regulator with XRE-family HTH domain
MTSQPHVPEMFSKVGQALALIRQERGISQYELADLCRIGRSQVSKYEAGKELMKLETLAKLLRCLNVSPEQFFHLAASLESAMKPPVEVQRQAMDREFGAVAERLNDALAALHEVVRRSLSLPVPFPPREVQARDQDAQGASKSPDSPSAA